MKNDTRTLILASNSPRRSFLLKECGFEFQVQPTNASEDFDAGMEVSSVPAYLATIKAEAATNNIKSNELIITADTVVILDGEILNKPSHDEEAIAMLSKLSGNTHRVITAVCMVTEFGSEILEEVSWVTFNELAQEDIINYVKHFKPFDKAGAYGAQECLPENYNPCSGYERDFLHKINNTELLSKSKPAYLHAKPLLAIQEIAGSYFNVMGLPIARLYDKLKASL